MRQVPQSFLILGSGRVSKHIGHYFDLLKIPFQKWNRKEHSLQQLQDFVKNSSHILMAVSDQALPQLEKQVLEMAQDLESRPQLFHFSGATNLEQTPALHPLMSFGPELYNLETYQKIHFVTFQKQSLSDLKDSFLLHLNSSSDKKNLDLSNFIPGLKNKITILSEDQQGFYHSLCVLGGNFPVLLWNKMDQEFLKLGLSSEASQPYLQQILKNYLQSSHQALTGPFVRNDEVTIEKNLAALKNDPYQQVYEAFRKVFQNANQS